MITNCLINILYNIHVWLIFSGAHFSFQFEVHKYSNGDNSEEHDKYFNSNWRTIYISENSESKSVDCNVFNGKFHSSSNLFSTIPQSLCWWWWLVAVKDIPNIVFAAEKHFGINTSYWNLILWKENFVVSSVCTLKYIGRDGNSQILLPFVISANTCLSSISSNWVPLYAFGKRMISSILHWLINL